MIHSRRRARPDSTSAAAAASPRPRPTFLVSRPCCPRTRSIQQLASPRDTTAPPRGPTTAAARRPPPSTSTRSRPSATRTATPTARGSLTIFRRRRSRTARSASRAATACGGGSANSGRTRPSPSGPSPCGGGAASACAAGYSWGQLCFGRCRAVFRAESWSGHVAAFVDVFHAGWRSVATRGLPSAGAGAAQGRVLPALSRRIWPCSAPGAAAGLRISIKEAPTRRLGAARVDRADRSPGAGLPTRLAGTGS